MTNTIRQSGLASVDATADRALFRQSVSRGLGWKFGATALKVTLQFGVTVVLSRLLPPEDFGLIALAWIAVNFGNMFVELGLGPAIIQRKELTDNHIRVAFTASVLMGFIVAVVMWAAAPSIAGFLRDPRIAPVLGWLALLFITQAVGIVSQGLLARQLAFKTLFYVEFASSIMAGVTATILAVTGYGLWSLVTSALVQSCVASGIAYAYVKHPLSLLFARRETRELATFSVGTSLARVFNFIALQGDYLIVGRFLGPSMLGLYSRAYNLMTMPTTHFVQVIGTVLFPAASRLQDDEIRFRDAYQYTMSLMALVLIPVLGVLVILSPELIRGIYGEAWIGAIMPLQILGAFGAFRGLYNGAASFVRARGWIYQLFLCQVVYAICVITGTTVGALLGGIEAAAWAVGLSVLIMWASTCYYANKATSTSPLAFIALHRPGLVLGACVCSISAAVRLVLVELGAAPLLTVILGLAACALAVVAVVIFSPGHLLGGLPRSIAESLRDLLPRGSAQDGNYASIRCDSAASYRSPTISSTSADSVQAAISYPIEPAERIT